MDRIVFLLLLALTACGGGAREPAAIPGLSGEVMVDWKKGAGGPTDTTGHFTAPAVAAWCAADTLLEVLAIRNDTAFGMSLLPADSLHPANFPLYPALLPVPWRPQALVALRYMEQFGNMGFEAVGGQLILAEGNGRLLSGSFEARLRRVDGKDSVRVTGRFSGLQVRPATGPCGRASKPRAR